MQRTKSHGVDECKKLPGGGDGSFEYCNTREAKERHGETKKKTKKRHPLKMPLRTDPVTKRIICRFHNYDAKSGCKKYSHRCKNSISSGKNVCELDHETCHVCLEKGHPAHRCIHLDNLDSDVWKQFCSLTLKNTRPEDYPANKTVLGDPIVWIGDTTTIMVPSSSTSGKGNSADVSTNLTNDERTTIYVSPPKIAGFKVGEDDQLGRCRRQKKIEAAFMLQLGHGSVVVDAGAHLGDTVLTLAIHARTKNRKDLRFVALEPCPEKCDFLRLVAKANDLLDTISIKCAAVGDSMGMVRPASNAKERAKRDGSLRYEYCQENWKLCDAFVGASADYIKSNCGNVQNTNSNETETSLSQNKDSNASSIDSEAEVDTTCTAVPIITLDSIIDEISPLGMLHIDVEGWESNVLRGAKKSLNSIPEHDNDHGGCPYPCYVIAEAWTEQESLRRGVLGNAEEKIVSVMEGEVNNSESRFRFDRSEDIVDIERNLLYIRRERETE